MRVKRVIAAVSAGFVAAGLLAACGGGSASGAEGVYSLHIMQPENPLVPGNTTESEGNQVLKSLFTPLVRYNDETSEVEYTGVAKSVESEDQMTWTIELNEGWTFHDGTPVTAKSYVDAWNYTALSTNAYGASYFFENVKGYDELQAADGAEPAATTMSGLEAVNDTTISVELKEPFAIFPVTLGYTAFYPLPEVFFDDPEAFGRRPIGNGPFKADEDFVDGQGFTVTKYEDYAGDNPAQAEGVQFKVYTELTTAFTDVQAGGLDVLLDLPSDAWATARDQFGDRYVERARPDITALSFPTYDERFADPRVREAFSMAIDRQAITTAIFTDTRTPAASFGSPVVEGYREDACGAKCELNVEQANKLLDEAGFDRSRPVDLWFNAGAGHDQWMTAIGNQFRSNLGVEYVLRGDLQFAQYLPLQDDKGMTGPFRMGWIMDYPSLYNFLAPVYSTAAMPPAGSNMTFYSNPEFDAALSAGNNADTLDDATVEYQRAEDILFRDMPATPLFYGLNQAVTSDRVDNVKIDAFGDIVTEEVTVG
ncbi:ABC transporter substrate-binding protein [Rhodococcus pyridinivorans]|uniref:peptide ABC transporter substrate-binding protein n=1 Tax=Rhodococcus pyridinivorans TaxID=103816 RepID=UPI001E5BECFD|nr:ABC transporter substrate-binding protein [Rhodococcus pyridinivorans]UGQ57996.1 ABC transporter substrate-binding protein [Rhodococcus pyridinivorans]